MMAQGENCVSHVSVEAWYADKSGVMRVGTERRAGHTADGINC